MNAMTPKVCIAKYPMYKDSGWDWLGKIPSHWEITTIGALVEIKCDRNHPDYEVLSVYREYGVIPKDSRDDNHNATSLDTTSYKAVTPGDLVINKMKAWQGSMGVSGYKGIVSPAYITCKVYTLKVWPPFFHYLLRCSTYIGEYNKISYGVRVGQWDMHYEDFKRIGLAIPSITEQKAIAEFINTKTALIDKAISIKERQIELLKERRDALINKAVTKGLNPNVKMKDSGVEWIGEVPEHWEITKAKYYSKIFVPERAKPELNNEREGKPWVTTEHLRNNELFENDISTYVSEIEIRKAGSRVIKANSVIATCVGNFGIATKLNFDCIVNQQIQGYSDLKINPNYLVCLIGLSKDYFENNSTLTTIMYVSKQTFGCLPILLPSKDEQVQITEYVRNTRKKIEVLTSIKNKEIEKLKEYKASLINSAVTGKIKVC